MFVIGAMLLIIVALLSFGGVNFFSRPQRFLVYFDESIHGLDLGSAVKLRGVRVGRVADLNVQYNAATNKSVVAVLCEFSRNMIIDDQGKPIDVSDRAKLQAMVDHGLRAQLGVVGLATGLLFVELDFYDPGQYPAGPAVPGDKHLVVPAVPSTISEYQASLTEILSGLKRVDFAGLSRNLDATLVTANQKLQGIDTARLSEHWIKAADAIQSHGVRPGNQAGPRKPEHRGRQLARIDRPDRLAGSADQRPAGADARRTPSERWLHSTTQPSSAQRFVAAQSGIGEEANLTMQQLREAAAAVERLADFLERHPNAIITGRKPE